MFLCSFIFDINFKRIKNINFLILLLILLSHLLAQRDWFLWNGNIVASLGHCQATMMVRFMKNNSR